MSKLTRSNYLVPKIASNLSDETIAYINKNIGSPHGITSIVLSMVDKNNIGKYINIQFDTAMAVNMFVDYALSVWKTNKAVKVSVRSYKQNDSFIKEMDEFKFEEKDDPPVSYVDFLKFDAIVDIVSNSDGAKLSYTFKIYRLNEPVPRLINLTL